MWQDRSNLSFLFLNIAFSCLLLGGHLYWGRERMFFLLQLCHNLYLDAFFQWATHLGNAWVMGVIGVLTWYGWGRQMYDRMKHLVLAFVLGSVMVIVGKSVLKNTPRLAEIFQKEELQLNAKVRLYHWRSFPSGHTVTAVTILAVLSTWASGDSSVGLILGIVAVIAGYSRVYLNQHFALDIAIGVLIGVVSSSLAMHIIRRVGMSTNS